MRDGAPKVWNCSKWGKTCRSCQTKRGGQRHPVLPPHKSNRRAIWKWRRYGRVQIASSQPEGLSNLLHRTRSTHNPLRDADKCLPAHYVIYYCSKFPESHQRYASEPAKSTKIKIETAMKSRPAWPRETSRHFRKTASHGRKTRPRLAFHHLPVHIIKSCRQVSSGECPCWPGCYGWHPARPLPKAGIIRAT